MNKNEIIQFISENQIDKNTPVVFTIIENGQTIKYKGRVEFNFNGTPAISDDRIGIRVQRIKDASDMPYVGGLEFNNLIGIEIHE